MVLGGEAEAPHHDQEKLRQDQEFAGWEGGTQDPHRLKVVLEHRPAAGEGLLRGEVQGMRGQARRWDVQNQKQTASEQEDDPHA